MPRVSPAQDMEACLHASKEMPFFVSKETRVVLAVHPGANDVMTIGRRFSVFQWWCLLLPSFWPRQSTSELASECVNTLLLVYVNAVRVAMTTVYQRGADMNSSSTPLAAIKENRKTLEAFAIV